MATVLSTTIDEVEKSIYESIRLILVEHGYLPDTLAVDGSNNPLYPDTPAGNLAWKAAVSAVVTSKGFCIELFGVGSSEKKYKKEVPRIVIVSKRYIPGDLGGGPEALYIPVANNTDISIKSPDGHLWKIIADNVGMLSLPGEDLGVLAGDSSITLQSPNGHSWKFTVDNSGIISLPGEDLGVLVGNTFTILKATLINWRFTVDDSGMLSLPGESLGTKPSSFNKLRQADKTTEYQFEIWLTSNTAKQDRILNSVLALGCPSRGYINFIITQEPQNFFVEQFSFRDSPNTEEGINEKIYMFRALDLYSKEDQIIATGIPSINTIDIDIIQENINNDLGNLNIKI